MSDSVGSAGLFLNLYTHHEQTFILQRSSFVIYIKMYKIFLVLICSTALSPSRSSSPDPAFSDVN